MKPLPNDYNIVNVCYIIHKNESKKSIRNFYKYFERLDGDVRAAHLQRYVDYYTMRGIESKIITDNCDDAIGLSVKSSTFSYTVGNMSSLEYMIVTEGKFRKLKT